MNEVINTFKRTVEHANVKVGEKESQVTSLQNELDDTYTLIASLRNELETAGIEKEKLERKCSLMAEEMKELREKHADTIQTLKNQYCEQSVAERVVIRRGGTR